MGISKGLVVSATAGYYFVESGTKVHLCRGRGRLRLGDLAPLVGDSVLFKPGGEGVGVIEKVLPRRNYLLRPAVANVDIAAIILAPHSPSPNLLMADKLTVQAAALGLEALICVNKADLDPPGAESLVAIYRQAGFTSLACSAVSGEGLTALQTELKGRVTVLAGQSGVGKSHISALIARQQLDLPIEIGKLSARINRGKHTTRQVSLLPLTVGGKIADTPGFSVFSLAVDSNHLHRFYPEFHNAPCKFSPCYHVHEPGCAVKAGLARGEIGSSRYTNYVRIYQELKEEEANRY